MNPPPSFPSGPLPPREIPVLARLCITGDLENNLVSTDFYANLDAYLRKGYLMRELWPVLLAAIQYARPNIITALLSRGLSIHQMHVMEAIHTKSKEVFQALHDNGWNLNDPVGTFYPPALASFVNDPDMIEWFLDHGANPDVRCYLDLTPLSLAARYASVPTLQALLHRGSANRGQLAHHAIERDQDVIVVLEILATKGAPLDELQYARHPRSWNHEYFKGLGTPLHRATELGKLKVACYLLEHHADRNIRDSKGRTPLDIARAMGFTDLIHLLEFC